MFKYFFLLAITIFLLSGFSFAQRDIRYYEFYDLLDYQSITSIRAKYFRGTNQFIYQDALNFNKLSVEQLTGYVNVFKNRAIVNFAQVNYTLDKNYRILERNHIERNYSSKTIYSYYFSNLIFPTFSSLSSSNLRFDYVETSVIKNNQIVFSRKENRSEKVEVSTATLNSNNQIVLEEVKPTELYYGNRLEYFYNADNSYKIIFYTTKLNNWRQKTEEKLYDSKSRLLKIISFGKANIGCKEITKGANQVEEWRYKFDSRKNWIEKTNYFSTCEGLMNPYWKYTREIMYQ